MTYCLELITLLDLGPALISMLGSFLGKFLISFVIILMQIPQSKPEYTDIIEKLYIQINSNIIKLDADPIWFDPR